MIAPVRVLIIVPCYNEQESLPSLLEELLKYKNIDHYQIDVAIVNDCSKDNTREVASKLPVILIDLPVNLGIGGAVQSGLIYARNNAYHIAIQMDGDGQHPPKELGKLLHCHQHSGADVVIGSRFLEKEGFQSSFTRRLGIAYFHWLNRFFTRKSIYDSTSGYRLFGRKAIELAARHYPDDYPEPESLVMFARAGLRIKETPVIMQSRNGGQSSIRNFASLYYCIKVTLAMLFSSIRKIN